MMNFAPERCSAPKTANGMAKHKLLKTTISSRPVARAISVLAAHSAIRKSRRPAPHIETAVREISKNMARMVVYMWMGSAGWACSIWGTFSRSIQHQIVQRRVGRDIFCEAGQTPDLNRTMGCFLVQLFTSECVPPMAGLAG